MCQFNERITRMMTGVIDKEKPDAGEPYIWFDDREVASAAMLRRGSLLYKIVSCTINDAGTAVLC